MKTWPCSPRHPDPTGPERGPGSRVPTSALWEEGGPSQREGCRSNVGQRQLLAGCSAPSWAREPRGLPPPQVSSSPVVRPTGPGLAAPTSLRAWGRPPPSPPTGPLRAQSAGVMYRFSRPRVLRWPWPSQGAQGSGLLAWPRRGHLPQAPPWPQAGLAGAELPAGPPSPCCLEARPALVAPGLLCPHSFREPPGGRAGACGAPGASGTDPGRRGHLPESPEPRPKEVRELWACRASACVCRASRLLALLEGEGENALWAPCLH